MKFECIKLPTHGGVFFVPDSDMESEKMKRLKNGGQFTVVIDEKRNPVYHRKVFALLRFCFEFWCSSNEYQEESKQFEVFRNHLTVLAGYYKEYHKIGGGVRVEADTLSYEGMTQEQFREFYEALLRVATDKLFLKIDEQTDADIYNKLLSFILK